jgi:hypothetical protein
MYCIYIQKEVISEVLNLTANLKHVLGDISFLENWPIPQRPGTEMTPEWKYAVSDKWPVSTKPHPDHLQ